MGGTLGEGRAGKIKSPYPPSLLADQYIPSIIASIYFLIAPEAAAQYLRLSQTPGLPALLKKSSHFNTPTMLQPSTIKFVKALKKNNNKPWFDANRKAYDAAKSDFASFVQRLIDQHAKKDPSIQHLLPKDCMFRINRDVRFSKDKSPYKTNFGASINRGGKKSTLAGYYFHLEPGASFAGGGMYVPMPDELRKVRQEIDYNLADFKKIVQSKKFKSLYGDLDRSKEFMLTRIPKGYEPDNPAADYLRFKSFITMINITDADLTSKDLVKKTVDAFVTLQPLIGFLNNAIMEG